MYASVLPWCGNFIKTCVCFRIRVRKTSSQVIISSGGMLEGIIAVECMYVYVYVYSGVFDGVFLVFKCVYLSMSCLPRIFFYQSSCLQHALVIVSES